MKTLMCICVTAVVLTHGRPSMAQNEENAEAVVSKRLGLGYKIGNGLGFVGADVIISPVDHVTLDLQANWFSASGNGATANGYGFAPAVQFHLFKGQVSSPYLGLGYIYSPEPDISCDPKITAVLTDYIRELAPPLESVYQQRFVLGRSQVQASSALGLSRGAIRIREDRLRRGLRKALVRAGISLRDCDLSAAG